MTQWTMCLPCQSKGQSSAPQKQCESWVSVKQACNPSTVEVKIWDPWDQLAKLADQVQGDQ